MNLYLYEMGINRKKIGLIFITTFVLVLVGLFIIKQVIINKFETYVENLPNHIDLQYDEIDLNLVSGNVGLIKPLLTIKGQTTNEINAQIEFKAINFEDLSYWDYFKNDRISVAKVKLSQPEIDYYHNKIVDKDQYNSDLGDKLNHEIRMDVFEISNANIEVYNIENDSLIFATNRLNLQLDSLASNVSKTQKLPFVFKNIRLSSENLKYSMSEFEDLFVSSFNIDKQNFEFHDLKLKTKYSTTELSKRLTVERDHYDLSIPSIIVKVPKVDFDGGKAFGFKSSEAALKSPNLTIYRDKLINDDLTEKQLFSEMLRNLTFDLAIDNVLVESATIVYQEKVKSDKKAGELKFSDLKAEIKNFSNIYPASEKTEITINSTFMEHTPIRVDWSFDVNNIQNKFIYKAEIGVLQASALNQFMEPNLNIRLEGELLKTYFTIDGNSNTSLVDLKTDYEAFDVVILKENGKEKNKFLSGLVNLFIAKNSRDENSPFRYSDTKKVERDKTKSVFNFIWKNMQSGLLSAMSGDGKKDN